MKSRNSTFEYFDYEPSSHSADARAVFSSLAVMLIFIVGIIAI